jgi:hypothetical protein
MAAATAAREEKIMVAASAAFCPSVISARMLVF